MEVVRRYARSVLPAGVFRTASQTLNAAAGMRLMGPRRYRSFLQDMSGSELVRVDLPTLEHPFWMRPTDPDLVSVTGAMLREDMAPGVPEGEVRAVIDAGGYIGDSAVWLLSRFPTARVASVEPDGENFALLERNLGPYGDRAVGLRAGVWHRPARLRVKLADEPNALEVEESPPGAAFDCEAVTIPDILGMLGESRLDLLKCNIEGAEKALFSQGCDEWLDVTRAIIIQLHDEDAVRIVRAAVDRHGFEWRQHRYLHILRRR